MKYLAKRGIKMLTINLTNKEYYTELTDVVYQLIRSNEIIILETPKVVYIPITTFKQIIRDNIGMTLSNGMTLLNQYTLDDFDNPDITISGTLYGLYNINMDSTFYRIKKITQLIDNDNILGYDIKTYKDLDIQTHNQIKYFLAVDDSQTDDIIMEFKILANE